jgi:hypothetical protein
MSIEAEEAQLAAPVAHRVSLRGASLSVVGLAAALTVLVGLVVVATRGGSQGPTNSGLATAISWQSGDISPPTAVAFERLVSIGDQLYLIASANGVGDGTMSASEGIWASTDGLKWNRQAGIDAVKSPGTESSTFADASSNGRGSAVLVGSEQTGDGVDRTAAWWTSDGKTWVSASVEGPAGRMLSVASRPDVLVAVGVDFSGNAAGWRSTDGGSSWRSVSLPGAGRDAVAVTVWGDRFVAIGRSQDANDLLLWTSPDGAVWSLAQSPSDPSFYPSQLIPLRNTLAVLGHGVPGSAILTCGNDLTCARATVPVLGYTSSFTEIRAGAELSGTIVLSALSATAGTAASPGSSTDASSGVAFWASTDGRNWTTPSSSPSPIFVISNLVVFNARLVAVTVGPDLTPIVPTVMTGDLR